MARDGAGYPFTIRDLSKRTTVDPTVKAVLDAWSGGRYPSLEAALIGLAVTLSIEKAKLQKRLNELVRRGEGPGPETR